MDLTHPMRAARVIKDSFGKCCLARINMGTDAYISYFLQIFVHLFFLCDSCLTADSIRSLGIRIKNLLFAEQTTI